MATKKPIPTMIVKSYLLMFDFHMPNDLTDATIHELGTEVTETFRAFFAAKRIPLPVSGTLTIMREEEGDSCDADEPFIPHKKSNASQSNTGREKDTNRGAGK